MNVDRIPDQTTLQYALARALMVYDDRRWRHRHQNIEFYYDIRSDEPGGPRTYHEIGWACGCGRILYGRKGVMQINV